MHAVVDALGNPIRLKITDGGQVHDIVPAAELIEGIAADHVGADKAYDAQNLIDFILKQGATAVIPPKKNRRVQRGYDRHLYKERHLIECFFCKIKEFRRIVTRYEKLARTFLTMLTIASCLIWLR